MRIYAAIVAGLGIFTLLAKGQNTGTVFSPDVTAGKKAAEYRIAWDPDRDTFAQRVHYQYGLLENLRLRAILSFRSSDAESFDFRYLRLEGMVQLLEDQAAGFDSALRLEIQLADGDDPPSRFRLGWSNKVDLDEFWQLRGILLTGHQFGADSSDGFLLESRAQISRKWGDRYRFGVDYYGDFNDTEDIGSFDEQEHQIGPLLKFDLTDRFSGQAGILFGISDAAADQEFRLNLITEF